MNNIILCGYRSWSFEIFEQVSNHSKINVIKKFNSNDEFVNGIKNFSPDSVDFILFIGWSWIIESSITQKYLCLGIHPSDLPLFRGGSPLQHQIISGIKQTKVTLMTLSDEKIDAGDIWLKEDLDLLGDSMSEVFKNIVNSTVRLLTIFFDTYPNILADSQEIERGTYFKRRKPSEGKITIEDFQNRSLEQNYNFIRCLTDPYPNAYIEDNLGNKLFFTGVKFVSSKENN